MNVKEYHWMHIPTLQKGVRQFTPAQAQEGETCLSNDGEIGHIVALGLVNK